MQEGEHSEAVQLDRAHRPFDGALNSVSHHRQVGVGQKCGCDVGTMMREMMAGARFPVELTPGLRTERSGAPAINRFQFTSFPSSL